MAMMASALPVVLMSQRPRSSSSWCGRWRMASSSSRASWSGYQAAPFGETAATGLRVEAWDSGARTVRVTVRAARLNCASTYL